MNRLLVVLLVVATAAGSAGCVFIYRQTEIRPVELPPTDQTVQAPLRVHLLDGRTALFIEGATITESALRGTGILYDLNLVPLGPVEELQLDELAGVEAIHTPVDTGKSVGVSVLASLGAVIGVPLLAVAVFGSCPTVYSSPDGSFEDGSRVILEAEGFSHSIAPLLASRSMHRLTAQPRSDGTLTLEVRNEALETHFINQIELLSVTHPAGSFAYPTAEKSPIVVADPRAPRAATDREGRDVLAIITATDDDVFSSTDRALASITSDDLLDWIDLEFDAPDGEAALLLEYRDSLLGTIIFYEKLLQGQGPRALDWLQSDLQTVSGLLELGDFYRQNTGMRVLIWDEGEYRLVKRLPHVGPIAWSQTAIPLPAVSSPGPVKVRVEFPVDAWRIDRLSIARVLPATDAVSIPVSRVSDVGSLTPAEVLSRIERVDDQQLVTMPGSRFSVTFDTGSAEDRTLERSHFLAMHGYYTEWMRPDWLRNPSARVEPTSSTLYDAIVRWRDTKGSFEETFFATKIPVR